MSSASSSASFKSSGLDPKPAQKSDETTPSLLGQTNTTSDSDKSLAVEHIISTDQDITPPRAENLCSSSSGTAQINSLAAPDGDGPPQLPTLPAASSDNQIPAHFPASFSLLMPGMKCYNTESELVSTIHSTLGPFGIKRLTLGSGSRKNTRDETKELFPHKRFSWICSSCSVEQRKVDVSVKGCCGFRIRVLLVENNRDPDHEPHLLIREFELPPTSRHLHVSPEVWSSANKILKHEDELSPTKTKLLKSLGTQRVNCATAKNIMAQQFDGLKVSKTLLHRLMRKGRNETWGGDESESMMIFYSEGLKLRDNVDPNFGVSGKF